MMPQNAASPTAQGYSHWTTFKILKMEKISFLLAFVALFATASFASTSEVQADKSIQKVVEKVPTILTSADFPVEFVTSCGTWTGTANCGSLTTQECFQFLNDVADYLESLC